MFGYSLQLYGIILGIIDKRITFVGIALIYMLGLQNNNYFTEQHMINFYGIE